MRQAAKFIGTTAFYLTSAAIAAYTLGRISDWIIR